MATLLLLTIALLLLSLYLYTVHICASFPTLSGKRIILLIAHPDDEAMFFAPTVLRLTNPALGNHLKILCLSTGTAGGEGAVRRKELYKSAGYLGLRDVKEDVLILDDPNLQDSATWSPTQISNLLLTTFAPTLSKTPTSKPATTSIDILLTFDATGVSSHHNHTACHSAALDFVRALSLNRAGWTCPVTLYTLTSVPIWRKYIGFFDCLVTMLAVTGRMVGGAVGGGGRGKKSKGKFVEGGVPGGLLCVSGLDGVWKTWSAMVQGHWSQMLWFRWGWIGLARYMVVNDLKRVK